jgi:hypothetical protein
VRAIKEYSNYWSKYCNSYRCNPDTYGNWKNLLEIYETYFDFENSVCKGHYFDLDMLDFGTCRLHTMWNCLSDDEKILELTGKIEETLGKENSAMISDTLGEIITGNSENIKAIADRDSTIKQLQDRNEKLISANGALLQKIPMEKNQDKEDSKKEVTQKKINLKDAFDAKGNFIH